MLLRTCLVLAAALALAGCSGPCDRLEEGAKRCGDSFNRGNCDRGISKCTSDDIKTLDNVGDCLNNDSVCKDGKRIDGGKYLSCVLPEFSISDACANALQGK